jgi:hypothetical protein
MSTARRGGAAAALLVAALGCTTALAAHAEFVTAYQRPQSADYLVFHDQLRRERFLERVADELNRVLELPATVTLRLAECGHSTTAWDGAARTVTVCYEFLDAVLVIAAGSGATGARVEQLFSGAVTFALFAEVGRALVELYALPAPQGAERAGDEFAALTLAAAERAAAPSATAGVEFFALALEEPESGFEYLETHRFDRPRLETVACLLSGRAAAGRAAEPLRDIVPAERAPHCADELAAVAAAWDAALRDRSRGPRLP